MNDIRHDLQLICKKCGVHATYSESRMNGKCRNCRGREVEFRVRVPWLGWITTEQIIDFCRINPSWLEDAFKNSEDSGGMFCGHPDGIEMPRKKMYLFVWEDVLIDYTSGIMVALAPSVEEARAALLEKCSYLPKHDVESDPSEVIEVSKGSTAAFYAWGGG